MTIKTINALVDASSYAESVCHHAAWIATRTGARVKLYHVMGRRSGGEKQDLSGAIKLGARSELLKKLSDLDAERAKLAHEQGRAIIDDAKAILEDRGVTEVVTRLRQGDLVESVTATENTGDLIVIGKRGEAAGVAMEHLGSNLERVVRASHKPVFVANRAFRAITRVLVAFDGGTAALRAVDYIARSPLFADLSVTVVHVGTDTPAMRRALDGAAATLRAGGIDAATDLRSGQPEKVLGELTDPDAEGGFDLLVMGAYSRSRIRSLFVGSTTTEMVRSCRVPVLLMH
jgi:nucleotide-binding universal stress UspA family protein